jgi:hypothetical protein
VPETRTTSSTGGQKGTKLARFDLIPAGPLRELAEHYGRGARKYANHQWRQGYEWSKSIAALARHFNDFMAGKDYDVCENDPSGCSFVDADGNPFEGEVTEHGSTCFNHTGSHHMAAVAWHSFLLLEFKDTHPAHDDRYVSNALEIDPRTELALEELENYETDPLQREGRRIAMGWVDESQVWTADAMVALLDGVAARFHVGSNGTEDVGYVGEYRHFLRKRAPQA